MLTVWMKPIQSETDLMSVNSVPTAVIVPPEDMYNYVSHNVKMSHMISLFF